MVRLRLRRVGRKKQPSYRIVAADSEASRDGKFLEVVGFYNPRTDPSTVTLKEEAIYSWLGNGAQPSDTVARIFKFSGLTERYERFKAGEDIAKLMTESEAWQNTNNVSNKTRVDTPVSKQKAAPSKAEAVKVDAEPEEAVVEEAPEVEEPAAESEPVEAVEEEAAPAAEAEATADTETETE